MAEEQPSKTKSKAPATGPAGAPGMSAESMAEKALDSASKAAAKISAETTGSRAKPVKLPKFEEEGAESAGDVAMSLLDDVTLRVKVELGRTQMYVEDVLRLNTNSVVELDKAAGDPVDIYVNDRHVARGEVLVLNENFCVRVSEIIQQASAEE